MLLHVVTQVAGEQRDELEARKQSIERVRPTVLEAEVRLGESSGRSADGKGRGNRVVVDDIEDRSGCLIRQRE